MSRAAAAGDRRWTPLRTRDAWLVVGTCEGPGLTLFENTTLLSSDPRRRAVERQWLLFTPVWGAAAGLVMLTGLAETWGDVELMLFGVALMLGALVPPVVWPHANDRARVWHQRTACKMGAAVTAVAFLMNYFCTPYFFDVLHMHYGFNTRLNIQHNPVFLYLMTVAYFATYSVLLSMAYRWCCERWPRHGRKVAFVAAPLAVAFLETALNANPFMKSLFCFDDATFMLTFGTLSYGTCFMFVLPVWGTIDEGTTTPWSRVVVSVAAAMMGILVTFELLRYGVAPYLTDVVPGANGLRDFAGSCLVAPR